MQGAQATETNATETNKTGSLPEVLTVDEAADLLRVNRKTLYAAIRRGEIPGARRVGRTVRISRTRLVQWLANGQAGVSLAKKGGAR